MLCHLDCSGRGARPARRARYFIDFIVLNIKFGFNSIESAFNLFESITHTTGSMVRLSDYAEYIEKYYTRDLAVVIEA
jgi:hypothetical protein